MTTGAENLAGEARPMMHSRLDANHVYLEPPTGSAELLGYSGEELVGTSAYRHVHPQDLTEVTAGHAVLLGGERPVSVTYRARHREGGYRMVVSTSALLRLPHGDEIDSVIVLAGRTDQSERSRSLEQQLNPLQNGARSLVAMLDPGNAAVLYANPLLEQTIGAAPGALKGTSFFELLEPQSLPRLVAAMSVLLHQPRGTVSARCALRSPSGPVPLSTILHDLADDPAFTGLLLVAHEVPIAPKIKTMTSAPGMTTTGTRPVIGVVDGAALRELLTESVSRTDRPPAQLAVVRLDELAGVGAALGADASSQVLREAARRLARVAGQHPPTWVAHLGVGRFGIVTEGLGDIDAARSFGELLRDVLGVAFHVRGEEVFLLPRVAVAQPGTTADGLLAAAHQALEQAEPGPRVVAFVATRSDVAGARLRLRSELHHAIDRDQLVLHYQPLLRLVDNQVSGAEALVRWRHPVRGLLAPGEFLELVESSGFIMPLGAWVLRTALHELPRLRAANAPTSLHVCVNVSTHQLLDKRFPEAVTDALAVSGQPASALCLEITETAVLDSGTHVTSVLRDLRDLGIRLAIDDFGTGHANLSYLKTIPAGSVKIDRSFINGLEHDDPEDAAIVAGTIAMAHALGRTVTAEGVETHKQLTTLREYGCDNAQGFLFSRPVPSQDFTDAVAKMRDVLTNTPQAPRTATVPEAG